MSWSARAASIAAIIAASTLGVRAADLARAARVEVGLVALVRLGRRGDVADLHHAPVHADLEGARSAFANTPAATRAAVSRADARSSTLRTSS